MILTATILQDYNGRKCDKFALVKAMKQFMQQPHKHLLGELSHPVHLNYSLTDIAGDAVDIDTSDVDNIKAKIELADTPAGSFVQAMIDADCRFATAIVDTCYTHDKVIAPHEVIALRIAPDISEK